MRLLFAFMIATVCVGACGSVDNEEPPFCENAATGQVYRTVACIPPHDIELPSERIGVVFYP